MLCFHHHFVPRAALFFAASSAFFVIGAKAQAPQSQTPPPTTPQAAPQVTPQAAPPVFHAPSPQLPGLQNSFEKKEIARVRIHNTRGGLIEGSRDGGQNWETVGHIVLPVAKVNPNAYLAAKYAQTGSVAATAVNAMHIKAGFNQAQKRGIIWSLIPSADTAAGRISMQSEIGSPGKALAANAAVSPDAAARTDIPGGTGLFGGAWTPFVGSSVWLDAKGTLTQVSDGYVPKAGDVWQILIEQPRRYPTSITFENRTDGLVTAEYRGQAPQPIARVIRPVGGVGRFIGSYFSEVGRVRANHPGVIDLSTSNTGRVGSFQIVPEQHAREYGVPFTIPQYLILAPLEGGPELEGTPPLFYGYIRPRFELNDLNKPLMEGLLGRFSVEFKRSGSDEWTSENWWMEQGSELYPWMNGAIGTVTHIRLRFPFTYNEQ
ncbi:MAG TPA: hypothetical protein VGB77_22075 [Abditibacteriaceae bacterium]